MDLTTTRILVAASAILCLVGTVAVRLPARPGSFWGWLPSHYLLLTGLAGLMIFGLHWLALVRG